MADLQLRVSLQALDKATGPLRRIMGAATGLKDKLLQAEKGLRAMQRQQALIDGLRRQQQATASARAEWRAASQRLEALRRAQAGASQTTREQARALKEAERHVRSLHAARLRQLQALRQVRARMMDAGMQAGQAARHEARLKASMQTATAAIEQKRRALERLNRIEQTKKRGAELARNMGLVGAGAWFAGRAALSKAGGFLGAGEEFEAQMSRVQALTRLDKNSAELAALRAQARQLGADTMFSATEAAEGQAFLGMAGFDAKQIQAAMPGLLDMAKAGDTDLGRTADIGSNILGGFGLAAEEMSRVSDVLTQTMTTSNVTLEMLGETMKYVAPQARAAGASLEEMAAMTGLLGNVGIQSSQAGTALRAMLLRLAAPTGKATKALAALKVQTADAQGNMRGIIDVLADVAKATQGMGSARRMGYLKQIFGEEPASAVAELIDKAGSGGITAYLAKVRDSQGAAARTAQVMSDNVRGLRDELGSAWDDVKIGFFDQIAPELKEWGQLLLGFLRGLGDWVKDNPATVKWLARLAVGFGVLATAAGAVLVPLALVLAKVVAVRYVLSKLGLGLSLLGGGFGQAAGGAGLLARAAGWLRGAVARLAPLLAGLGAAGALAFGGLAVAGWLWYRDFDNIMAGGSALLDDVVNGEWRRLLGFVPDLFRQALDGVGQALQGTWIADMGAVLVGYLAEIRAQLASWIAQVKSWIPGEFLQIGRDMVQGLKNGITGSMQAAKEAVQGLAGKAVDWFKSPLQIHSPSRVFEQLGGFVSEGAALGIARRAPRVAKAAAAMAALPALAAAPALAAPGPMLGTGAGGVAMQAAPAAIHVTINAAPGQDAQAIARAVSAELDRRERARAAGRFSRLTDL